MSGTLFIRLAAEGDQASWVRLDEHGRQLASPLQGSLAEASQVEHEQRVVVLVPAMQVMSTRATVPPTRNAVRLRQMLPYSLEELLAQDVDELFFAIGPRHGSDVSVAIVARDRLNTWLHLLAEAGIGATAIHSEADGVPHTPGALTLIAEGERIFGRWGDEAPFVFDGLGLVALVELATKSHATESESPGPPNVILYADQNAYAKHERDCGTLRAICLSFEIRLLDEGSLPRFAATLSAQPGTNLLQGDYAPRSNWLPAVRPWRFAAGLLLGLIALAAATQAAQYLSLQRQERSLAQIIEVTCREHYGLPQMSACRSEMQRRLAAAGQAMSGPAQGFLVVLLAVAQNRDSGSQITALSYRNGVMDLRLRVPSVPVLDEFVQRMSESNLLEVRIQSANPADNGVESQLQIVARGS
jgi:general secretion pathway protein L